MKIDFKYGIGEIVCYDVYRGNGETKELISSELLQVIGAGIDTTGVPFYTARYPKTGQLISFSENDKTIIGDPDFNQETLKYVD